MAEQQDIDPRRTAIVAIDFPHDILGAAGAFADLFHAELKRTNETAHNASLASMAILGEVVTTDDLLATLRARASSLDADSD